MLRRQGRGIFRLKGTPLKPASMKRLPLLLLTPAIGLTATAADFSADGIFYTILDPAAKTVEIESVNPSLSGQLDIPGSIIRQGEVYTVVSVGNRAFYWTTGLTGVSFPKSVTTIGTEAFKECTALKEIDIPATVETIGRDAFSLSRATDSKGRCLSLHSSDPLAYGSDFLGSNNDATAILVNVRNFDGVYNSNEISWGTLAYPLPFEDYTLRYETLLDPENHLAVRITGEIPRIDIVSILPKTMGFEVVEVAEDWTLAGNDRVKSISFDSPMERIPAGFCANTPKLHKAVFSANVTEIGNGAFDGSAIVWASSEAAVPPALGENVTGERTEKIHLNVSPELLDTYLADQNWNDTFEIGAEYTDPSGWRYTVRTYPLRETSGGETYATLTAFEGELQDETLIIPAAFEFFGEQIKTEGIAVTELPEGIKEISIEEQAIPLSINCNLGALAGNSLQRLTSARDLEQGADTETMFGGSTLSEVNYGGVASTVPAGFVENCTKLKSVTLGEGVTTIGDRAFAGALALAMRTSLDFMADLPYLCDIGDYAFEGLRMTDISFPKTLQRVGAGAFHKCGLLEKVNLAQAVEYIGEDAFNLCDRLVSVIFGSEGEIGDRAFFNCSKLTTLEFSNPATRIGVSAFEKCFALEEADLMADVIEERAFADCSKLRRLSVTGRGYVSMGFITDCPELTELSLDLPGIGGNVDAETLQLTLAGASDRVLAGCPKLATLTFGDRVKAIPASGFRNQVALREVTFGSGVELIGEAAFSETGLELIQFPTLETAEAKTVIQANAFFNDAYAAIHHPDDAAGPFAYDSNRRTEISFGSIVKSVGSNALKGVNVSSLDLGNSIESLNLNCSGEIETLAIPAQLKYLATEGDLKVDELTVAYSEEALDWNAFGGFPVRERAEVNRNILQGLQLNGVENGRLPELNFGVSEDAEGLTSAIAPTGWNGVGVAFDAVRVGKGVKSFDLTKVPYMLADRVIFEDGVEEILGSVNFSAESSQDVVSFPSTLRRLDADFFYSGANSGESPVKKLIFRDSEGCVAPAGEKTLLSGLPNLEEVYMGTEIEGFRFSECGKVTKVVVGDMVKSVGTELFRDCSELTNVIMGDNVTEVRQGAFQGCAGLKVLSMSENLATIGENAYADCTGIERIVARSEQPAVGTAGFNQVIEETVPLYVPDTVLDEYAFSELFYRFDNIRPSSGNVIEDLDVDDEAADRLGNLNEGESMDLGGHVCGTCGQPLPQQAPRRAAAFAPEENADPDSFGYYFFTPNPDVLSVDANGLVTVLRKEPAEVWVYALDGSDCKRVVEVNNAPALVGDLNGDGVVDSMDINMLVESVASATTSELDMQIADLDKDGVIDSKDINLLIERCVNED